LDALPISPSPGGDAGSDRGSHLSPSDQAPPSARQAPAPSDASPVSPRSQHAVSGRPTVRRATGCNISPEIRPGRAPLWHTSHTLPWTAPDFSAQSTHHSAHPPQTADIPDTGTQVRPGFSTSSYHILLHKYSDPHTGSFPTSP